jgi:hypothetical protein
MALATVSCARTIATEVDSKMSVARICLRKLLLEDFAVSAILGVTPSGRESHGEARSRMEVFTITDLDEGPERFRKAVSDIGCLATQASVEKEATAFMDSLKKLQVNRNETATKIRQDRFKLRSRSFAQYCWHARPRLAASCLAGQLCRPLFGRKRV